MSLLLRLQEPPDKCVDVAAGDQADGESGEGFVPVVAPLPSDAQATENPWNRPSHGTARLEALA
ncbi:hypothetical protein GCM10010340_03760 [Streptomyces griseoloalbus]|nr:hypothetical protein GCM10010340_03760 [Streptomyces albaduncus]